MNTEPKKTEPASRPSMREALKGAPRRLWMLLYHNWPWKLLALFLALCLWAGLIMQDATLTRDRVFTDVPVSVTGADSLRRNSGLIVLSGLEEEALTVRLRVDVPQREYNSVTASFYNPRIDLTRITATGEQTLKISTTSTTTYGSVESVSPESVTVLVDEYVTNYRVPVSVNITGEYPEGFYGAAPTVDPSVVALSGPKSIVDQVVRICVDFDLSRLTAKAGKVRTALAMRFVDADGEDVESRLLEVSNAGVVLRTIIVEQTLYSMRTVPISDMALVEGEPASGYRLKGVTLSPSFAVAAGSDEALDAIDELLIDKPVDITGVSETFTTAVRVSKPSDLTYISTDTVNMTVEIEPVLVSRTFDGIRIAARGSADSMNVGLGSKTLSLVLSGPEQALNNLRGANVTAYVDVSGLEAGEYELPIQLFIEGADADGFTFIATPSSVSVTLAEK